MNLKYLCIGIIFFNFSLSAQTIRINEIVSSNSFYEDEDEDTPDWLELYNYGTESVSIDGWFLSDDPLEVNKWKIPNTSLAPNKYIRIWASSKDRVQELENLHTNFKISSSGQTLLLSNPSGALIDKITAENLPHNTSIGISKISNTLVNYTNTTPGLENSNTEYLGTVNSVLKFSDEGGLLNAAINLSLSGNSAGETIRYTTDSTVPTENDLAYTTPISIDSNTVIRARIFAPNYIPTIAYNKSFVFNTNHRIDLMLITIDPEDFSGNDRGINAYGNDYEPNQPWWGANFWEDWERPAHFSFYEKGNNPIAAEYNCGVKIYGGWMSRQWDQRSLSIFARSKYGDSKFEHSFFDKLDYDKFEALVIRNSGNDWLKSSIKDITLTSLMRGSGLDFQEYNPVAAYINTEYWGLYNLREKINEHFLASKHGIDPDDITLLENAADEIQGTNDEYYELIDYVSEIDLSDDQNFQYVADRMDLMNYTLYQATQIFYANQDWPGNNVKYWKTTNGKWRWILFDVDSGFGMYDEPLNPDNYDVNMFNVVFNENGPSWPNPRWSTLLFRKLNDNIGFRHLFINRYADEMNTRFLPDNVKTHIDNTAKTITTEIEAQYERWDGDVSDVNFYVNKMKNYADVRPGYAKDHILEQYNLPNFHPITIQNNTISKGFVRVNNNLKIQENTWTGDYFQTVPIKLRAVAEPGYVFSHWSGAISSTQATISIDLENGMTVTPNFEQASIASVIINEINYKSGDVLDSDDWVELYNPNSTAIDISNWQLKDSNDTNVFNIPDGTLIEADAFIVLVKKEADFKVVFPNITNYVGNLGFGLGTTDAVRLFNANGILQDDVNYSSISPWPTCPNGTGQTLELITTELDNSLAENWNCITTNGSPDAFNKPLLSVDDNEHTKLKLFPNPVDSTLNLVGNGVPNIVSVQIINLAGQEIITIENPTHKINVEKLQKGFYFIKIQFENSELTHKFIKK